MLLQAILAPEPLQHQREVLLQIATPLAAFLIALLILLGLRWVLFGRLYRSARDRGSLSFVVLDTLRVPSALWCVAASLAIALRVSTVPPPYIGGVSDAIAAFLIISISLVIASVSVRMATLYWARKNMALAEAGMARALIRVLVFSLGALALMNYFRWDIRPVLTALGVGGLAVALALQDTLSNFFAGIHILVEEPIRVGNMIRLSSGEEGVVTDIGWRTTRVRTGGSNMIVIPNTKITSGILTNFTAPSPPMASEIAILVGHDADPEQVTRIALEEAAITDGALQEPAPKILFEPGFTPTHLQFKLVVMVSEFSQQGPVQSDLKLRLLRRFRTEGVPLPRVAIIPLEKKS